MSFFNPSFESLTPTQITSLLGSSYSLQMLNYVLPMKLDKSNYILWRTQMKNVIFTNGFEDHIEGLNMCPTKMTTAGTINPEFISWRRYDCMILNWLRSSLTPEIIWQIVGYQTSHEA